MTKMAAKWPKLIPYLWPKRLKNPTLWGRTYLYSPYKGVPPPPGLDPNNLIESSLVPGKKFDNILCALKINFPVPVFPNTPERRGVLTEKNTSSNHLTITVHFLFSASCQTRDCSDSKTSSVTSSGFRGRQCKKTASFLARDISWKEITTWPISKQSHFIALT